MTLTTARARETDPGAFPPPHGGGAPRMAIRGGGSIAPLQLDYLMNAVGYSAQHHGFAVDLELHDDDPRV